MCIRHMHSPRRLTATPSGHVTALRTSRTSPLSLHSFSATNSSPPSFCFTQHNQFHQKLTLKLTLKLLT